MEWSQPTQRDHARPDAAISVIISTRNRAHYLPEVLRTLAVQECEAAFEVIVVDNGSSDDTPALLDAWCRADRRFRTITEPRPGLSRGKNAGIRAARAPLLLFTDDDVRVDPNWIASYRRLFEERSPAVAIAGGPILPIPRDLGRWPEWLDDRALADAGMLHHRDERPLGRGEYVWGANMAVRRLLFDHVGPWNETIGLQGGQRVAGKDSTFFEDTELQDRVRNAGGSVWFCPGAAVQHRVGRDAVTPRRLSSAAFARGRNEFWKGALAVWHEVDSVPMTGAAGAISNLVGSFVRWGFWAVLFRASRGKRFFDGVRCAASAAGQSLDSLRAGRSSPGLYEAAAWIAFPVRRILLRLVPDVP